MSPKPQSLPLLSDGGSRFPGDDRSAGDAWYVVCRQRDLKAQPQSTLVLGIPTLLYRDDGEPRAFLDRCPHRNVPLSSGHRNADGNLRCPYHGWLFDSKGTCVEMPGRTQPLTRQYRLTALPVREESGLVWVCPTPEGSPRFGPYVPPLLGAAGYTTVVRSVLSPGSLHATAENALDVPHTSILHQGLFRGAGRRSRIHAQVRRWRYWAETQYVGEPAPRGLAARLLAVGADAQGALVQHWDRFFLPGVLEVEYRLGERTHFVITGMLTPEGPHSTRIWVVASFKTPLPGWLVALLLEPVGRMVFRQDQSILARQSENLRRFGEERYVSTELDAMGPHIKRLLRSFQKSANESGPDQSQPATELRVPNDDRGEPLFSGDFELDA